jgi:hypothetical protein
VDAFRDSTGVPVRWVEVAPLVFREVGGQSLLAFCSNSQDKVTAMFHGDQPILVFQKLAWYENPHVHLAGLGLSLFVFVVTLGVWSVDGLLRLVRRTRVSLISLERRVRFLASSLILLDLVVVGTVLSVLVSDDSAMQFGFPAGFTVASALSLLTGFCTFILLVCTIGILRPRNLKFQTKLHYALVSLAALYFTWYLSLINLLRLPLAGQ